MRLILFAAVGTTEHLSLFEALHINPIFNIGFMLLLAIIGGKLIERLNFPKVTGYIIVGIFVGPSFGHVMNELFESFIHTGFMTNIFPSLESAHIGYSGLISENMVHTFQIIRQVAIGMIGYTIGLELKFSKLKRTGKQVTVITLSQAFTTAFFVAIAILGYFFILGKINPNADTSNMVTFALILGAIATATAPAPIVAVVKNYRTKGPVTDVLLPLVALDDAIGIMLFATMLSVGVTLLPIGGEGLTVWHIIYEPVKEIVLSIGLGAILGFILTFIVKKFNRDDDSMLMMFILISVFLGIGIGQVVHASAILLPMTIGVVLTNNVKESFEHRLTRTTDLFAAPIMVSFFIIAGLELDVRTLPVVGVLGVIYILVRVLGKVLGSNISAKAINAPPTVQKYLGWTLIPQAGVAIDMAITANQRFSTIEGFEFIGSQIMTIVLAATVVYEVLGLIIVKTALNKAGEIDAADVGWDAGH
jgi:Kef-type K+ transport system membrane component KefB